ncbi:MAG TPA: hypothetical protein DD672_05940 [Gammaproteobacteria bacterium]|nr:hypothetical protein [Gammaproteobacteria bacterium]
MLIISSSLFQDGSLKNLIAQRAGLVVIEILLESARGYVPPHFFLKHALKHTAKQMLIRMIIIADILVTFCQNVHINSILIHW